MLKNIREGLDDRGKMVVDTILLLALDEPERISPLDFYNRLFKIIDAYRTNQQQPGTQKSSPEIPVPE